MVAVVRGGNSNAAAHRRARIVLASFDAGTRERRLYASPGSAGAAGAGTDLRHLHALSTATDSPNSARIDAAGGTVQVNQRHRGRPDCRSGYGRQSDLQQPLVRKSVGIFTGRIAEVIFV